jgi:hypothetical protein
MLFCRSSTGEVLCCSEDLRSGASLVSKVSITVVVQSQLLILGIHATACRLFSASILVPLLFFAHSQSHSRFIAIVLRAISSPCCYRYPPRSTEPIPLVPHSVVLQTMSIYHCRYSPFVATAVISVSQVILSLLSCRCRCRPLHPRHKSQHPNLAGARTLERVYCHESRYVSFIQLKIVVCRLDP